MEPQVKDLFRCPKEECSYSSSSKHGITTYFKSQHHQISQSLQNTKRRIKSTLHIPITVMGGLERVAEDRITIEMINLYQKT